MAANDNRLSARKQRFVAAMLSEGTILDAAKAAGLSERTAHRYLDDPNVKQALSAALDGILANATRQVTRTLAGAIATLDAVHSDGTMPPSARVSAAKALLAAGLDLRESVELSERVERLEEHAGAKARLVDKLVGGA